MVACTNLRSILLAICLLAAWTVSAVLALASSASNKPHHHNGVLEPFVGRHLSYRISIEDEQKLQNQLPVIIKENRQSGKGKGTVIQDIHANPDVVLRVIANFSNYRLVVPNVRGVDVYEESVDEEGRKHFGAQFHVAIGLLKFKYFLNLHHDELHGTLYWTLDYRYKSDFDDNTGQWQVLVHPNKSGWSRVVYSTDVQLFSWIPGFVVTFLTNTALVESTTWVKKVAESTSAETPFVPTADLSSCFRVEESISSYDGDCGMAIFANEAPTSSGDPTDQQVAAEESVQAAAAEL